MEIRKSTLLDLPRMLELYAHARAFMTAHGNPRQWASRNWPPESLLRADIAAGESYVCTRGAWIGAVFLFRQGRDIDPTYRVIHQGAWGWDAPYGVVHRLASDGSIPGAGSYCLRWALEQSGYLRVDTHGDNTVMQGFLNKLDFVYRGIIYVAEDNDPRLAYDRRLDGRGEET